MRASARPATRRSAASAGRGWRCSRHQVRYDLRASLRNPRARFFTFFFPILLLVIFDGRLRQRHDDDRRRPRHAVARSTSRASSRCRSSSPPTRTSSSRSPPLRETGVLKRRRATPRPAALLDRRPGAVDRRDRGDHGHRPARDREGRATASASRRARSPRSRCIDGRRDAHVRVHRLRGLGHDRLPRRRPADRAGDDDAAVVHLRRVHPSCQPPSTLRTVGSLFPVEHLAADLHLASVNATFTSAVSVTDLLVLAAWGLAAAAFAAWRFSWLPSSAQG